MRVALIASLSAWAGVLGAAPSRSIVQGWEYAAPGVEATAVLIDSDGNILSAGQQFNGIDRDMVVVAHDRETGGELWRYVVTAGGPTYQNNASMIHIGQETVVATYQRDRYQEYIGAVVKLAVDGSEVWRVDPSDHIGFYSVAIDANGDVVAAGAVSPPSPVDHDLVVIKFSGATGGELWRTVIPGVQDDVFDRINAIAVDANGDVYAGGRNHVNDALGHPDFVLFKLRGDDGAVIWENQIPSVSGHGGAAFALALDHAGNIVAGGQAVVDANYWCDWVVAKFSNNDGHELWRTAHNISGCGSAYGVAVDSTGDVVATGLPSANFVTRKYDGASGAMIWEHEIDRGSGCGGGGCAGGHAVRVGPADDVFVIGHIPGDWVVARLDAGDGHEVWKDVFDRDGCGDNPSSSFEVTGGGDVFVGGRSFSRIAGECAWPDGANYLVRALFRDFEGDGVGDEIDSCVDVYNPDQIDSDFDGYGNACDADYDQNGQVGISDFALLNAAFGASLGDPNYDPRVDSDGDEHIGIPDFGLFRSQFGGAPGPSGLACAGSPPCPAP